MRFFAITALAITLPASAIAQHQTFVLNPGSSQIKMTLNTTHEVVIGAFQAQSGSIEFDRSSPTMSGSVVALAGSGKTGNDSRDNRMNKSILLVDKYRTFSFEPKSYTGAIAPTGDSTIQVTGAFTLLGTPHAITIPMLVHLDGENANVKTHFTIPYIQWGVKNPSFLVWKADPDVAIDLDLSGRLSK